MWRNRHRSSQLLGADRLSAGDKIADSAARAGVYSLVNCLIEFVTPASGKRPQRIELAVATATREKIPMRILAAPNSEITVRGMCR
jgi:hypothetical protein